MLTKDDKSIPTLFADVVDHLGHLVRTEVRLAQAELSQKIQEAGRGVAYLVVSAVLMIPVIVMLLDALALWLSQQGLALPLAYLVSGLVGAVLSIIFASIGLGRLKLKRLKPEETIEQISQDVATARTLAR